MMKKRFLAATLSLAMVMTISTGIIKKGNFGNLRYIPDIPPVEQENQNDGVQIEEDEVPL